MEKCACKGFFLERFVQPAILMHLAAGSHHGFSLLKKLADESYIPGESYSRPRYPHSCIVFAALPSVQAAAPRD